MHDALETTFDQWCRRQAEGQGLRVGLIAWPEAGPTVLSRSATPGLPISLSLRKSHVFADRYVPGVLEESRLIVPVRLLKANDPADTPTDAFGEGSAVWRSPDGDRPLSIEDLAMLVVLSIRQAFHNSRGRVNRDPGFELLTGWVMTTLDADDGRLLGAIQRIEPRVFGWWGRVLQRAGEFDAAERAWIWQVEGGCGPPDAAVRSLLHLMESVKSSPADRLGLCRRAQRIFDDTGYRDFDLQTTLDLARAAALIDLGYRVQGLETLHGVNRRLIANPCGGALRQSARTALLSWRAGGMSRALATAATLGGGVARSGTARYKLRTAWAIRRVRGRRPRLPPSPTIPGSEIGASGSRADTAPAIRRVALVRLDRIGDLVCMQPVVARVRARFPEAAIDLYVTAGLESFAEQLMADANLRSVGVNWKEDQAFRNTVKQATDAPPYDLLIDLLEPDAARHVRLTREVRATYKIGFDSPARRETFTHRVPLPDGPLHLIDRTARLLRPLGVAVPDRVDWRPRLTVSETPHDLSPLIPDDWRSHRVIGMHVGAGWRFKRWYPESFAAVGRQLVERFGVRVAVLGGPGEESIAKRVAAEIGEAARVLSPSLDQLPGLIASCALVLVNDSGPMHIAVALGVPTVVAWGPGDRTLFAPRGDPARVAVVANQSRCANYPQEIDAERCPMGYRYEDVPCLRGVTVDAVRSACEAILATDMAAAAQ
ncbi:MAG: glycosyltransferase family 9 protein [Planctomycetota bacterium]